MALFSFRSKKAGEAVATEPAQKQPGFIARLRGKLNRGDSWLTYDLANLLPGGRIDEAVLDELETRLIDHSAQQMLDELSRWTGALSSLRPRAPASTETSSTERVALRA